LLALTVVVALAFIPLIAVFPEFHLPMPKMLLLIVIPEVTELDPAVL
jgi:hypothetical protein